MSYDINFSKEFLDVLDKVKKVVNSLSTATKRSLLIFKNQDNPMISVMDMQTLVNISTGTKHCDFNSDEIPIANFLEFMEYIKAIDYPNDNAKIYCADEKSTRGKTYTSFVFSGEYSTYRTIIAQSSKFEPEYDRKVPMKRNEDPLKLVAKFYLDNDDLKRLDKDLSLMGSPNSFGVIVDSDEISIYMRGIHDNQLTKKVDELKSKVFDGYTTKGEAGEEPFKLFPSKFIKYMCHIGCDFEIEIRVFEGPSRTVTAIKAYGVIAEDTGEPINILVGTQESSAEVVSDNYEVIE